MNCMIRPEIKSDCKEISEVIKSAFYREDKDSEFNEWKLVENIRNSNFFIEQLSLVAIYNNEIVGHILFSPMEIIDGKEKYQSLALAPIAVKPEFQNKGIGHQLIIEGIKKAKELGYGSIIVLGHPTFYTKFGFELASKWHIGIDDKFDCKYLFALELISGELSKISGIIKYCDPFYNEKGELI